MADLHQTTAGTQQSTEDFSFTHGITHDQILLPMHCRYVGTTVIHSSGIVVAG